MCCRFCRRRFRTRLRRRFAAAGKHNSQQNRAERNSVLVEERVSRHGHNQGFQQDSGQDRELESSNLATVEAKSVTPFLHKPFNPKRLISN